MNQLYLTFEAPHASQDGLRLDNFIAALEGIQDAMRLMVEHLGCRQTAPGNHLAWVQGHCSLRLATTESGSFVAALTLTPPPHGQPYLENYGARAFNALQNWDGSENSTLPRAVTDRLYAIPSALTKDARLWLGSADDRRKVEIKRVDDLDDGLALSDKVAAELRESRDDMERAESKTRKQERQFGLWKGKFTIIEEDDEYLEDFKDYMP